jgi:glycerophosphoryl diester phosphodiesterase
MGIVQRFATEEYVKDYTSTSVRAEPQDFTNFQKELVRGNINAADIDIVFSKLGRDTLVVGNWTPIVTAGADSITLAEGSYVKIGNMCILTFTVSGTASTTSARLTISGIPFQVSDNVTEVCGGGQLKGHQSISDDGKENIYFKGWVLKNSGNIYAYVTGGSKSYAYLVSADAGNPTNFTGSGTLVYETKVNKESKIISVNHRGYSVAAPENTLPAFILSAQKGFSYVECDVSFTKDGVAVLLHDDTIDRTSNGTGSIADLYYKDLIELDFGSWFSKEYEGTQIPTFIEFIKCCRDYNLHPYIEIKDGGYSESQIQQIVDIVYEYGMIRNATFISFNSQFLTWVKNYCDIARIGFIEKTASAAGIATAQSLKTDNNYVFLSTKYTKLTDEVLTLCKDAGLPVEIWLVNDAEYIKTMDTYFTGITSDSLFVDDILSDISNSSGELLYYLPNSAFSSRAISLTAPYQKVIDDYSVKGKRLTKIGDSLTVTPGETIRMDIVGSVPLQGAIFIIYESGVTAIASGEPIVEGTHYFDSQWVESGYTVTIPEGAAYIWINLHKTDNTTIKLLDLDYVKILKVRESDINENS